MKGFITMIRDISDVVIDVSHTTIINTSNIAIVAAAYAQDSWKSLAPLPLLEPSANDISGILLRTTIIQGTDLSGITIGDNCTASGEYAVAMGWGADASGTEGFVYRDICSNVFAFDSGPPAVLRVNHQDPDAGGGTGGDLSQNMLSDFDASGTIETSGVILAPVHSAEGSSQSVITDLDPSTNPLMSKGMFWINEAQDVGSAWSYVAPMDISRSDFGCAALGGKIYVVGGSINATDFTDDVQVYDPFINHWSGVASLPTPLGMSVGMMRQGVAALGGKLYAVGGMNEPPGSSLPYQSWPVVFMYDPSVDSWSIIANMLKPRSWLGGGGVAAVGGKLYAVGGGTGERASGATLSSAEVYDPIDNSWNLIAPMPAARDGPVAVLGGKLYVVGGGSGGAAPETGASTSTFVYDPVDNSWNTLDAHLTMARASHAAAAIGGKLYAFGGWNSAPVNYSMTPTAEVYDPMNPGAGWSLIAPMDVSRAMCGAAVLGGELYVLGGQNVFPPLGDEREVRTIEVYDPSLVQMPQITYQGEDFYVSHQRGGPKTFIIPHPEHEGKMLRHACLEAPTRGTNVYEYQITTTEDNQTTEIALPSYFKHINGRVRVYVSVVEQNEWGKCRGFVNDNLTKAIVETEKSGTYNVMVTGVRKDPEAVAYSATENIDDPIDEKDI